MHIEKLGKTAPSPNLIGWMHHNGGGMIWEKKLTLHYGG